MALCLRSSIFKYRGSVIASEEFYNRWKNWDPSEFGSYTEYDAAYFSVEIVASLDKDSMRELNILEIGFGNGNFLGWCKDNLKASLFGVETSRELRELANEFDIAALGSIGEVIQKHPAEQMDLVAAFSVIEHLPSDDLSVLFAGIADVLKPGGVFVGVFPNGDSPFGRVYQNADVTHLTALGSGKMSFYASQAGLEILRLGNPRSPFRGVSIKRKLYKLARDPLAKIFELVLNFVYHPTARISYDANYVCVLRKPVSEQRSAD